MARSRANAGVASCALKIRFRREGDKKPQFLHMLNGTAIAVSRALISILENYQQKDGSILVPDVLKPYMGDISVVRRESRVARN